MDDKIDDVCGLMKDKRLDILFVNETKRKGSECRDEYEERLKDSFGETKLYECLKLYELWKVKKIELVEISSHTGRIISKAFLCEDTVAYDNVSVTEYIVCDGSESEITMDEIMKALKRMKVKKAARYDRVSSEMLRGSGAIVASLLYQLFSKWWKSHRECQTSLCVASPWIFNLFMDSCLYDLKEYEYGVRMDELSVKSLLYVNDQVILALCGIQEIVNEINGFVKKRGIKLNVGKTKVMVFEKDESTTECDILIEGEKVEQVKEFVYLGSLFTNYDKHDRDI
ncbi:hypothetical protein EVAR_31842_1 [Eumeta japonica]|uniref:Reverse transcriptase domain-containing protein n=1 Tax=Eumeta variegata TaxID=151549 RepID=A0A4C1WLV0_EUMVA|nr:hypothetical protein EVAR_31842_1 [Eumeta japonica]